MNAVPLGGSARSVYLAEVGNAVSKLIAGTARRLRVAAMRALPMLLLFCIESPLLAEAGHRDHGRTYPSQQIALDVADDTAVPHETGCLECPQHAWDRGREVHAAVLDVRVAARRLTFTLTDDARRPSVVGAVTKPPRA